jgi:hypothetical protein
VETSWILKGLSNAPVKKLMMVDGGSDPTGDECDAQHWHGFIGMEREAVDPDRRLDQKSSELSQQGCPRHSSSLAQRMCRWASLYPKAKITREQHEHKALYAHADGHCNRRAVGLLGAVRLCTEQPCGR